MLKIAIPTANGNLCMHFGHCEKFAIVFADESTGTIQSVEYQTPPPHEPGLLPGWIAARGVTLVIAGGMGERALQLFALQNIKVISGVAPGSPEQLVKSYLAGELQTGINGCNHDAEQGHGHGHSCNH